MKPKGIRDEFEEMKVVKREGMSSIISDIFRGINLPTSYHFHQLKGKGGKGRIVCRRNKYQLTLVLSRSFTLGSEL